ncbi:MAG TPA: c-type cytochrome, partial [Acidimicrobiales bacterium]|nr:c-type cytochrome [Acidimicrobiales bacterium]
PAPTAAATPAPAAAAPAPAAPAAPPPPPPPPPPYVTAAMSRPKIPVWALPVLAMLPIWAIVYAGVLFVPEEGITDPVLLEGQGVFDRSCASCHGSEGGGGVGRPLNAGEVVLTFPDPADHIAFVAQGSPPEGTAYGNPDRPGGQHIARENGAAMPAFADLLTEEELLAVVRYEREILGGETESVLASGEGVPEEGAPEEGAPEEGAPAAEGGEGSPDAPVEGGGGQGPPAPEAEAEGGNVGGEAEGGAGSEGETRGGEG